MLSQAKVHSGVFTLGQPGSLSDLSQQQDGLMERYSRSTEAQGKQLQTLEMGSVIPEECPLKHPVPE